jgi:WD40 repeat protein
MRNLEYPERIFRLPDSVTAVDFSTASPNLLAVGLANGTILIYNIARNADQPIVDSVDNETKHLGKRVLLLFNQIEPKASSGR